MIRLSSPIISRKREVSSMQHKCQLTNCSWASGPLCEMLEKSKVPLDGKWPTIILFLRGAKDLCFLSEIQKVRMQEILFLLLRQKDFSPENYNATLFKVHSIIISPLEDKLAAMIRETAALADDMQAMFGRRTQDVSAACSEVDVALERGEEPASILAHLRDTLRTVAKQMENDKSALTDLSRKDFLTGLANRRSFDSYLEESVVRWVERREPLALIMFDIDHFKKFNDTYGHQVGDQVLRTLATKIQLLADSLIDPHSQVLAARYGGEEFALVLYGKAAVKAERIAEGLRKAIEETTLRLRDTQGKIIQSGLQVSVSVGVAGMSPEWTSALRENLVDCADKALYTAKRRGRNCTVSFAPEAKEHYVLIQTADT